MHIGDRVLYTPPNLKRGVKQDPKPATILSVYDHCGQVRLRCDGEPRDRRVKVEFVEHPSSDVRCG